MIGLIRNPLYSIGDGDDAFCLWLIVTVHVRSLKCKCFVYLTFNMLFFLIYEFVRTLCVDARCEKNFHNTCN